MPETGAHVKPEGQYAYHWDVPERAGPGPADPDSVVWLYHAHDHKGERRARDPAGEGCSTLHSGLLRSRIIVAPSDDAAADNESADDEP
jgi:hypothetical protein